MLKQIYKRIVTFTIVIMIGTYLISLFVDFRVYATLLGMLVGIALSIVRIYMLDKSINKVVDMDAKLAQKMAMFNYGVRYLLTGVTLVLLAIYSVEALLGAAAIVIIVTKLSVYTIKIDDGDKTKFVNLNENEVKDIEKKN